MDLGLLAQYVMNGLMLGMMYALVAVGFTLFFGVLDVIKFSHGDVLDGRRLHRAGDLRRPAARSGSTRSGSISSSCWSWRRWPWRCSAC